RPGGHEQVRDLVLVEEVEHRRVRRGPESVEDGEDVVLLHELAHHRLRVRRVVAVVLDDVLDGAAVDTTVGVDVVEVRAGGGGDRGVPGGGRAGQRLVGADGDGVLGDTGCRLVGTAAGGQGEADGDGT